MRISSYLSQRRLAICIGLLHLLGCGNHSFDVVRRAQANLEANADASGLNFSGFAPLTLLDDQILQLQNTARRQLSEVQLHAVTLTVMQPGSSQDLTFLQNVSVVISAAHLPQKVVATASSFSPGQSVGLLTVSSDDFVDYFRLGDPTITVTGQGQAPEDVTLEAEVTLSLQVSSSTILLQ